MDGWSSSSGEEEETGEPAAADMDTESMSDTEPVSEPVRGMAAAPATPAAIPVENPRPADLAAVAPVPASPGSPAGSAAATADSKPEAEADWLSSMGKRFPPAEKK